MSKTNRCGGQQVCVEDLLTMEEDIEEPCVAMDEFCVSCKGVMSIREQDPFGFKHNPANKIFGKRDTTQQQKEKLWELLHTRCKIPKPEEVEIEKLTYVLVPSLDDFIRNHATVSERIEARERDLFLPYMQLFLDLVELPAVWNTGIAHGIYEDDEHLHNSIIQDIYGCIRKHEKVQFFAVHTPREIPIAIALYVEQLARTTDHQKFQRSLNKLRTAQGCVEAVIELARDELKI
jgi:hypothetical protein